MSSSSGFQLYRMAHHRLQTRQLVLGLEPLPVQLDCARILNTNDSSVGLGLILLKEQPLLHLIHESLTADVSDPARVEEQASSFFQRVAIILDELEKWSSQIPSSWAPQYLRVAENQEIQQFLQEASLPAIGQICVYNDPWIAYQMNFFHHGQLALRSSFIDLMTWTFRNNPTSTLVESPSLEIETQKAAITRFAGAMIESIPVLMGCKNVHTSEFDFYHSKKIGRCFAQGACWALLSVQHLPPEYRQFADNAVSWMQKLESRDLIE